MEKKINDSVLAIVEGDITREQTDAIVNAANWRLAGGGGVDGAIHRAGGPSIMEESRKYDGCPTGKAVITGGGDLMAKYVIHAVGPVYRDGKRGEPELLRSAYLESLRLASDNGIKSISFPALSAGAYGYPMDEAARIALTTAAEYIKGHPEIKLVRFVLFGKPAYDAFERALKAFDA
ncbi:MAG: O-acetyl-ADP-ribose deacetylase [Syntrophaceae bacterium]